MRLDYALLFSPNNLKFLHAAWSSMRDLATQPGTQGNSFFEEKEELS